MFNAHAHLELSQLSAPFASSSVGIRRSMADWVAALLAFRRSSDYDAVRAIQQAMQRPELLESTVGVADIVPPLADRMARKMDVGQSMPAHTESDFGNVRWFPFTELIGWRSSQADALNYAPDTFGLSPHAPYTVCLELLERAVNQCRPLAMHLAETPEELQLLQQHTGHLLDMMRRADPEYNPKSVLVGKKPMDYLKLLSAAPNVFIIHGNYLDDTELRFLAERRETMAVVYCPRSHAYFGHSAYPLKKMLDFGVRILLGTDSLASVPNLSMIEEVQFAIAQHPMVAPGDIYRMATVEGYRAFGLC